ncbi:hypothetical protein TWF173_001012 [Orbilia oligospora]|nr:hypothetical protein TWF173_001012 [Orbilia oligospora]
MAGAMGSGWGDTDAQSEGGRRICKHMQDPRKKPDPAFEGRWDSFDDVMLDASIYRWLQGVEITLPISHPNKPVRGRKRRRHNMDFRDEFGHEVAQDETRTRDIWGSQRGEETDGGNNAYSMEDVAEVLPVRPSSPQKRRLSLILSSEPSRSSGDIIFESRKFAAASAKWTTSTAGTRMSSPDKSAGGTRYSSPEKSNLRSKSRSTSPEKRSVTSKATGQTTMGFRRSEMAECTPSFIFGHHNRLASGSIPLVVAAFRNRAALETEYPFEFFGLSLFADSSPPRKNFCGHVEDQCMMGIEHFNTDAGESAWSTYVNGVLQGIPTGEAQSKKQLIISGIENRQLLASVTPIGAPTLRSDLIIEGNSNFPSPFADTCRKKVFPPSTVDKSLSPTAQRTSQLRPAFCVIEIKAAGGDLQEAQTQAAVVGAAVLLKARQIGANDDVIPFVPAIMTIGHIWHLNLIYEETNGIVSRVAFP